jgi:KDO2-lipid IV(A) lauroyltransferase
MSKQRRHVFYGFSVPLLMQLTVPREVGLTRFPAAATLPASTTGSRTNAVKRRHPLRDRLEYVLFRLFVCAIDILPTRACVWSANLLAFVFTRVLPRKWTRYRIARDNIRTAFGEHVSDREVDRMIHGMWAHLFRLVTEIVHLPRKLRLENSADVVVFHRRDELVRALCCGRPVIMLAGHFGNWEMANMAFGIYGFRMGVVARDFDNPLLHRWFQRWREQTGSRLISKKGGGGEMSALLERHGALGLLADQDAGSRGLFVPFFGKEASTFKSIALLAKQYQAVLCVSFARRLPDDFRRHRWVRYEIGCVDFIDTAEYDSADAIREITERYTRSLEAVVRRAPEQYFWVHRRWKSQPGERRRAQRAA